MRSFVTCTVLATVASMAVAQVHPRFEYPESVPAVEKRQEPGTPRYQCHEDCGLLITLGREDGFCTNSEWNERYGRCMTCANTYSIWMYYSSGVTSAAAKCGLSPTPSPSGGAVETTAAATTAAPAPATTTAAPCSRPYHRVLRRRAPGCSSAPAASTSAAGAPATTLSTAASASGSASASASGAATTSGAAAGTSAATVTRVTSIGTSVVIPSGTATPSTPVFAGAGKNAAAMGLAAVGLALAAF
ncbi:uncharacterized protein N0V96_010507 [Colletotrichum fioriniae]|uniref:uncharacterized protein n=1 Tax=Colletotrichum fioriniae TaxID=710243 RepID=UPI0032D9B9CD|nr:hypothetical protein N0V96_010507 [Colletotrichum fioriniae]